MILENMPIIIGLHRKVMNSIEVATATQPMTVTRRRELTANNRDSNKIGGDPQEVREHLRQLISITAPQVRRDQGLL